MPGLYDDFLADLDEIPAAPPQKPVMRLLMPATAAPVTPGRPVSEVRAELPDVLWRYLSAPLVTSKLLAAVPPGVGKTFAAVAVAEWAAQAGMRGAYVMPRHNFFTDLQAASRAQGGEPDRWFHWKPRHAEQRHGDPNCHWSREIATWAARGNTSMKFCAAVCGHHYISGGPSGHGGCAYHQQARDGLMPMPDGTPRIICIQHNHLVTNHALLKECDFIIGDESPLMAFCYPWTIPPAGLAFDKPQYAGLDEWALYALSLALRGAIGKILGDDGALEGESLYHALGGPERVLARLEHCPTKECKGVTFDSAEPESIPWQWHPWAVPLMRRECRAMLAGEPWMPRVRLDKRGMHLILRRGLSPDLPPKIIWLDATANTELYQSVTRWPLDVYAPRVTLPGPVYQVHDTLNTKATALDDDGEPSMRSRERLRVIQEIIARQGYQNPLIVTYSDLVEMFRRANLTATYFYANRGSNAYQDCDAVFVYGTPQLPHGALERAGQMLYYDRMAPFEMAYSDQPTAYAGQPWAFPAPGYWQEPGINSILRMIREDEIEQSAHRVRPVSSPKPVWIMTGIPVANLPPTKLMTTLDALIAHLPEPVQAELRSLRLDAVRLCDAMDIAGSEIKQRGYATHRDLAVLMQLDDRTARKYLTAVRLFDPVRFPQIDLEAAGPPIS